MHNVFISDRFRSVIVIHILQNMLLSKPIRPPLLLGIHGPSGSGKTFQCEIVLQEMGIHVVTISGGQLESDKAGEPAKIIRDKYIIASNAIEDHKSNMTAIVINDFDAGAGDWGPMVQYTVNRQQLYAELMHLVDFPHCVDGVKTHRIPIILTGNNFLTLYKPLIRTGRMWLFEWVQNSSEVINVIQPLYPWLNEAELKELVGCFPGEQVAFFCELKTRIYHSYILELATHVGIGAVVECVRKGATIESLDNSPLPYIISIGKRLQAERCVGNHLACEEM